MALTSSARSFLPQNRHIHKCDTGGKGESDHLEFSLPDICVRKSYRLVSPARLCFLRAHFPSGSGDPPPGPPGLKPCPVEAPSLKGSRWEEPSAMSGAGPGPGPTPGRFLVHPVGKGPKHRLFRPPFAFALSNSPYTMVYIPRSPHTLT